MMLCVKPLSRFHFWPDTFQWKQTAHSMLQLQPPSPIIALQPATVPGHCRAAPSSTASSMETMGYRQMWQANSSIIHVWCQRGSTWKAASPGGSGDAPGSSWGGSSTCHRCCRVLDTEGRLAGKVGEGGGERCKQKHHCWNLCHLALRRWTDNVGWFLLLLCVFVFFL